MDFNKVCNRVRRRCRFSKSRDTRSAEGFTVESIVAQKADSVVQTSETSCGPPAITQSLRVQKALVVARKGAYEIRDDYIIPDLKNENEIMIRNHAVGLNPIDWKSVSYNFCLPEFPWVCE
jgi:hypothetical protein